MCTCSYCFYHHTPPNLNPLEEVFSQVKSIMKWMMHFSKSTVLHEHYWAWCSEWWLKKTAILSNVLLILAICINCPINYKIHYHNYYTLPYCYKVVIIYRVCTMHVTKFAMNNCLCFLELTCFSRLLSQQCTHHHQEHHNPLNSLGSTVAFRALTDFRST